MAPSDELQWLKHEYRALRIRLNIIECQESFGLNVGQAKQDTIDRMNALHQEASEIRRKRGEPHDS